MNSESNSGSLGTMRIDRFLDLLASPSPTPGGGGIAALVGANAAGLISMVCHLTIGKEKYAAVQDEVKQLLAAAEGHRARLLQLVDEDAHAFDGVMEGYRLPKATDEEKRIRSEHIQRASIEASRVPVEIARECAAVVDLAIPAARITNVQAIGDVAMAAYLAEGAARGAVLNVDINLRSVKDRQAVDDLNDQGAALLDGLKEKVETAIREGMSRL